MLASAFAIDPAADAAFDAPKWLLINLAALAATALLCWRLAFGSAGSRPWSLLQRVVVAALASACVLAVAAAVGSEHGTMSVRALASGLATATLLFAGASQIAGQGNRRLLLTVAIVVAGATLVLSLGQSAGLQLPFEAERIGGRFPTGALLGNEGYVALLAALVAAAAVAVLVDASLPVRQIAGLIALIILSLLVIILNRQVTGGIALLVAVSLVLAIRFRQRWLTVLVAVSLLLGSASAMIPAVRGATWAAAPGVDATTYQRLTTFRLGGWVAAEEMIRHAPWLGHGPGSYAAESTARRLDAEIRYGMRFLQPTGATFVHAHQDWLQLAAECGLPAAVLMLVAYLALLAGLYRTYAHRRTVEPLLLIAVLVVVGVASLTWFPMQIPITAVVALLAAGRAWRLCSGDGDSI